MSIKNKKLGLFFTRGMSLAKWDKLGMFAREVRTYMELAKHFEEIYFFTYGSNDAKYAEKFPQNIKIVGKPKFLPYNIYSLILPFVRGSILKNIDIIKTNQMDGSYAAVFAKKIFGMKLVVRCGYEWLDFIIKGKRATWKRHFAYMVEKFAYKNADRIIITSESDKEFIAKTFSIPHTTIEVIPNYIDAHKFKPLDIPRESGRVLFLGRFEYQKNLFNLVKGMAGLPAKLVMIGNGSQKEVLIKLAEECNVTLQFLGNISQDNIPIELNKSEIFVLPSLYEGNPKALLEAMSCGVPCVGARSPGIDNVLTDGVDGLLSGTDAPSIHETLEKALGSSELRVKIGQGARETILKKFSLEKVFEKELNLHTNILHK